MLHARQATDTGDLDAIGAGVGVALGVAMNNLALWMAIGVGMGVAIGAGQSGLGRK